jgi:DNA-binding IclR family transcriptional regulator
MRPRRARTGTDLDGAVPFEAIANVFRDPSAVWTIDEVAGRFKMPIGHAIRTMSDLEAIGVVRRLGDEYVPGPSASTPG